MSHIPVLVKKSCVECGRNFVKRNQRHVYCSGRCRVAAQRKRQRAKNLPAIYDAIVSSTNLGRLRDSMRKR